MSEHLNTFFNTADKLGEIDIQISEDLLTILLLYCVPNSYENFRCPIKARDELPAPESLKIKFLEKSIVLEKGKTLSRIPKELFTLNFKMVEAIIAKKKARKRETTLDHIKKIVQLLRRKVLNAIFARSLDTRLRNAETK